MQKEFNDDLSLFLDLFAFRSQALTAHLKLANIAQSEAVLHETGPLEGVIERLTEDEAFGAAWVAGWGCVSFLEVQNTLDTKCWYARHF